LPKKVLLHATGDAQPARIGLFLQARRHIHAIAENVVVDADDVALVHAEAKGDAADAGNLDRARGQRRLNLDDATDGVDDARELQQQAVSGGLDDTAAVRRDLRIDQIPPDHRERRQRAALVLAHHPGIASDVGGHDCREAALLPGQALSSRRHDSL
jgi:hypothetical protein